MGARSNAGGTAQQKYGHSQGQLLGGGAVGHLPGAVQGPTVARSWAFGFPAPCYILRSNFSPNSPPVGSAPI